MQQIQTPSCGSQFTISCKYLLLIIIFIITVSLGGTGNPTSEQSHLRSKLLNFYYGLSDIKNRLWQLLGNSAAEVLGNCLGLCFTIVIIFATVTNIVIIVNIINIISHHTHHCTCYCYHHCCHGHGKFKALVQMTEQRTDFTASQNIIRLYNSMGRQK